MIAEAKKSVEKTVQTYSEKAPEKLKKLVARYAAEYRRISSANLADEGERRELQESLTNLMKDDITNEFNATNDKPGLAQGDMGDFAHAGYSSADCVVENGKVLYCSRCSEIVSKKDSDIKCALNFSVNLATGRINGLNSVEEQNEYAAAMNAKASSSYFQTISNPFEKDLSDLEKGLTLPTVCRRIFKARNEGAAHASPAGKDGTPAKSEAGGKSAETHDSKESGDEY